jgi:predicted alternative tryptophan synthase beta-subunit
MMKTIIIFVKNMKETKITLDPDDMPKKWYNILPDLPKPLPPPKDPKDGPSRVQNLPNIFSMEILKQEGATERYIPSPLRLGSFTFNLVDLEHCIERNDWKKS